MGQTVLIVLDVQNGVIERLKEMNPYLERLNPVIQKARAASVKIIHVVTAFRPGFPDLHASNPSAARVIPSNWFLEGDASVQVHPAISTERHDIFVTKRRVSAFYGTDLDLLLRSLRADKVVVTGLITSGAVLSTVRHGADLDYSLTVIKDLCKDRDEELHNVLMDHVIMRQARVVSSDEWVAGLGV